MMIQSLDELLKIAETRPNKRLVVVYAMDVHTIEAVNDAVVNNVCDVTLIGDKAVIEQICQQHNIDPSRFQIIHQPDSKEAGLYACDMINNHEAHLIMKGNIPTDEYMRCLLNKERGIMTPGSLLTHITCIDYVKLHKILIVADVAVIPYPTVDQKEKILHFQITTAHKLGNPNPRIALIAPSEIPNPKISSSADAIELVARARAGAFQSSYIDGPMALDLAVDEEAVQIKKYNSPVAGKADILLFPNIDAGNVFYKTSTKLLGYETAAMVVGAKVPAVLTSRGDSAKSKLSSIALATLTTDL